MTTGNGPTSGSHQTTARRVWGKLRRWARRALLGIVALFGLAAVAGSSYQFVAGKMAEGRYPPPGEMVDIGGYRLHLNCSGEGAPTVVMDAGAPAGSLTWDLAQAGIAKFTRACSYDRAGYAWSEAGPKPRTTQQIVQELHALLRTAGVDPPYVLVGHSFGGLNAQLYASHYLEEVSGMVLVDSSHPDQASRHDDLRQLKVFSTLVLYAAPFGLARVLPIPRGAEDKRDQAVKAMDLAMSRTTKSLRATGYELAAMEVSLQQVGAADRMLGDRPLIVLTQTDRVRDFWTKLQQDLSSLSSNSEWIAVEDAGHFIQLDQPQVVIEAVRRVVEAARSNSSPEDES